MRTIERTSQFKRDYKGELRGQLRAVLETEFPEILGLLIRDATLPDRCRDHALTGDWRDHRDCHIRPDLILIYRKPDEVRI
jgi:mRNA interferase YafQ